MKDGIIKQDGTSRLVKATLPATYEEFREMATNGTLSMDIMFNAIGWQQLPTFLNKNTLLKDTTAELFGLNSDSLPDDVLVQIKNMLDGRVRIATGTYRGTGTYGASNKCSLTFPFEPKLLILYQVGAIGLMSGVDGNDSGFYAILPRETTSFKVVAYNSDYSNYSDDTNYISFSGNTVTWYVDYSYSRNPGAQFNASTTYGYIIIGGGAY